MEAIKYVYIYTWFPLQTYLISLCIGILLSNFQKRQNSKIPNNIIFEQKLIIDCVKFYQYNNYNIFSIKMKRQYSFNEISQITMGQIDCSNKPISQPYYTGTKQNKDSWADLRVEQIKKKYDTPSHRKITSQYAMHEKNRENHRQNQNNPFASYRNALRDSITSPNIIKKQYRTPTNNIQNIQQDTNKKINPNKQNPEPKQPNPTDKMSTMKNLIRPQIKPTNKYINKYKQLQYINNNKIDPRVQNIDKINIKIKKILDCLHQNQNYNKNKQNKDTPQVTTSYMKKSTINKNTHIDSFHDTRIISRQKFISEHHLNTPTPIKSSISANDKYPQKYSLTPQIKHENTKYRLQQKYKKIKTLETFQPQNLNTINPQQQIKQEQKEQPMNSWFQSNKIRQSRNRSRSCFGNIKNNNINPEQQYSNTNKKLDDQIIKINTRIKQFEEQKKKLNIEFTPYNFQIKSNKSNSNLNQNKTYRCSTNTYHQYNQNKPPLPKNQINQRKNQYLQVCQKKYNAANKNYDDQTRKKYIGDTKKCLNSQSHQPFPHPQPPKQQPPMIPKQQQQITEKQGTPQFQQRAYKLQYQQPPQQATLNNCSTHLNHKTQSSIQQRKNKVMDDTKTASFSRQSNIFIQCLLEQVKLDQLLRNAKIWYRDITSNNKWQLLKQETAKFGIGVEEIQLEVTEEEDNPFYQINDNEQSYTKLVQHWLNSEKYWKQTLQNNSQITQQTVQKLVNEKMDLQKKGYFVIQDLVRFLNIQSDTFYRNRDLILIFRRLSKNNKIQWKQLLSVFHV